jgi:hypothetical protein
MLTIQNPTKGADPDTGIVIGSFKLVNAGLYKRPDEITGISGNYDYYCFYWSYNGDRSRFKCFLEREPIEGTTSMYNFGIYDEKKGFTHYRKVVNNSKRGLIYATSVGKHTHLKDRIGFYTWMTNQIVKFMGVC